MLIASTAKYYLKRARASAKEIEFDVPLDLRAKKDVKIEELFPLAIACIADLSAGIVRGDIEVSQIIDFSRELQFASKFYDSYLHIDNKHEQDKSYFYLVGAIAYYLCDQIGSSLVLAQKIDSSKLTLSDNKLDQLLCAMLQNKDIINISACEDLQINKYIKEFQHQYNSLMISELEVDMEWVNQFKKAIYDYGNYRDIFLIDALLAIFILKANYSIFNMLPKYSAIEYEDLVRIVQGNHFVKELWPSQRCMCELGLFNGKSGVIQMPTGAGKTKAIAIAIYSAFCSNKNLSVVVAPFRALCREISDDLKRDLSFNENIHISEISDLMQVDYIVEDLFNSKRKTVVVTTPEKLLYILRQDDSIIDRIGQLIFDEGHLFDDGDRGAAYELLISSILNKISSNTQKILISAIISNVDEINKWFAGDEGVAIKGDTISTVDKLPSVLRWEKLEEKYYCYLYYIDKDNFDNFDFYVPRIIEIEPLNKKYNERSIRYFPSVDFSRKKMKESNDMAIACLLKLVKKDNVAIFCGRKDSANKILERVIELNERKYDVTALKNRSHADEINKISNLINVNYGKNNTLYSAAILGIFAHHRGISDGIKNAIEYALKHKFISNIVCTSTLAQGVNLPIKYLIVSSIYQSNEQIKVRDFHNLIGRTARSGMFTEGTIIFSDPFVYHNPLNEWKWNSYKNLLEPNNSESCSSVLLDLVRTKKINDTRYNFFKIALMYYEDRNNLESMVREYREENKDDDLINWYYHIISTLGKIENYVAISIANNENQYSADFIDKMIEGTLAEALATEEEKKNLREIFTKICDYLVTILPNENSKRIFSKSLVSSEKFLALQRELMESNVCFLEGDELLGFIVNAIKKYGSCYYLSKIEKNIQIVEIAKMWMNGYSYSAIQSYSMQYGIKIYRRGRYYPISIEDIVAICDDDFGYSASLIISSISEILSIINERDDYKKVIENIKAIGKKLKYGLSEQTEIFIYELGFNDRYIAQKIARIVGICNSKSQTKKSIIKKREEIKSFLQDLPTLFLDRLENL